MTGQRDEVPGWFVWLDLAGYHARRAGKPKGTPPRVSAATRDGAVAAIIMITKI